MNVACKSAVTSMMIVLIFKVTSYTFKMGFICTHQKEIITIAAATTAAAAAATTTTAATVTTIITAAAATTATTIIAAAATATTTTTANAVSSTLKSNECNYTIIPDVMEIWEV